MSQPDSTQVCAGQVPLHAHRTPLQHPPQLAATTKHSSASGGTCRRRLCPLTAALPAQVPVLARPSFWRSSGASPARPTARKTGPSSHRRLGLGQLASALVRRPCWPCWPCPLVSFQVSDSRKNKPPLRSLRLSRLPPLLFFKLLTFLCPKPPSHSPPFTS
jgi:hypothetical protein